MLSRLALDCLQALKRFDVWIRERLEALTDGHESEFKSFHVMLA
jgi:hypothetical protein